MERSIVNWLKDQGVLSARRSEQYCGGAGDADILADELSSFHIESKGTKGAKLAKSTLKQWYRQIMGDVKDGKLPVIFHEANGEDICALVPIETVIKMQFNQLNILATMGNSFTPSTPLKELKFINDIGARLTQSMCTNLSAVSFQVEKDRIFLAFNGEEFVREMLKYNQSNAT